ncbi:low temperature requirement protein A [Micromonospora krabiensis]|uniref:Low temperature requirement protein LtrA n=1 Tax=Micromonospora krabiensis TaxID=307121 RepID=A0A1C3N304_9ACTN|nr:low temperature requirement protein A [Micromonospora krabiensis]SBV26949.1 Low temperature requirement protein LtrA [Micromonospora krabiensis]
MGGAGGPGSGVRVAATARRSSWLELFFDLVFVVAVFELGQLLNADPTLHGVLVFAGLITTIWWLWFSFSYFADLFDDDRPRSRFPQLTAMLGVLALAASLDRGVADDAVRYAVIYGLLLVLLGALYAVVGWHIPEAREFCWWNAAGFLSGASLWFASLAVPTPARYVLWGAGLAVNAALAGPLAYARAGRAPTQQSHMPERLGLFTIVVLGEAVLAVANGIGETGWQPAAVAVGIGGFVIACCIWWVYFASTFDAEAGNRAVRAGRALIIRSYLYAYGHLLVYGAIVASGVAVEVAAREAVHGGHGVAGPLLGGAQLVLMLGCVIVYRGFDVRVRRRVMVAQAGLVVAAVLIGLGGLPPTVTVALVALAWVVLALIEWHAPPVWRR